MIGKIIGAFIGGKAAQHVRGIRGPTGAALGVLAPAILRRMSWPAMVALGVGGYLAKKVIDKEAARPSGTLSLNDTGHRAETAASARQA